MPDKARKIKKRVLTVRARQKSIADLPAWAICCDPIRAIYESQEGGFEVEVIPVPFLAEVECRFCHRIKSNVKYMSEVKRKHRAIPVECFEFDEGQSGTAIVRGRA